jgi:hypothetical protein
MVMNLIFLLWVGLCVYLTIYLVKKIIDVMMER